MHKSGIDILLGLLSGKAFSVSQKQALQQCRFLGVGSKASVNDRTYGFPDGSSQAFQPIRKTGGSNFLMGGGKGVNHYRIPQTLTIKKMTVVKASGKGCSGRRRKCGSKLNNRALGNGMVNLEGIDLDLSINSVPVPLTKPDGTAEGFPGTAFGGGVQNHAGIGVDLVYACIQIPKLPKVKEIHPENAQDKSKHQKKNQNPVSKRNPGFQANEKNSCRNQGGKRKNSPGQGSPIGECGAVNTIENAQKEGKRYPRQIMPADLKGEKG